MVSYPTSCSDFMNSYTIAPVVPTIIADMRDPTQFPRISAIALSVISLFFGTIGFAGTTRDAIDGFLIVRMFSYPCSYVR